MRTTPSIIKRLTSLAVRIQQISAPTFHEIPRAEFILKTWEEVGASNVRMDEIGNVYACLRGESSEPSIVISAHLDTVFPQETNLNLKQEDSRLLGPGIGDNSLGLAGLFGIYWALNNRGINHRRQSRFHGDIWLVSNVCEEGLGDLSGMKAVVDHFGSTPLAYVVVEGMSLGQVYHRGLGVRRYRISVKTKGGHSWIDYGSPSAIHVLSELIVKINQIKLPVEPRSSINIGTIVGGTSVNTIASDASCDLDLRSENTQGLNYVIDCVLDLVRNAEQTIGQSVHVQVEQIGDRPTGEISIQHPLVRLAIGSLQNNGIQPKLAIGSTDANVPLSRGLPAICVGLTTGGGAHTLDEYIDLKPLAQGLSAVVELLSAINENRDSLRLGII